MESNVSLLSVNTVKSVLLALNYVLLNNFFNFFITNNKVCTDT